MWVRGQDVLYMTTKWKNVIQAKRKAEARYRQNKMAEDWEDKRKCRNEATKQKLMI